MTRLPDWPERLDMAIDAARQRPFEWGAHDCVTFAAACIQAVTGTDPIADLRGWDSRDQAGDRVAQLSGRRHSGLQSAIAIIFARYGWPEITPRRAGRGDICLVAVGQGRLTAVCLGAQLAAPGPRRLQHLPLTQALATWRIG